MNFFIKKFPLILINIKSEDKNTKIQMTNLFANHLIFLDNTRKITMLLIEKVKFLINTKLTPRLAILDFICLN